VKKGVHGEAGQPKRPSRTVIVIAVAILIGGGAIMVLLRSNSQEGAESASTSKKEEAYEFRKDGELKFISPSGKNLATIAIEVAADEAAITIGLMNRKVVPEMHGMLFVFQNEEHRSFWMRNTYASLDILFVNSNREIVALYPYTQPLSDTSYPSTKPAQYVVEVAAGFADRHGIQVGDRISWTKI